MAKMAATAGGDPAPLGATLVPEGVNFSVYARGAEGVDLLLYHGDEDLEPSEVIPLDPTLNRDYHYWHVLVPGLKGGQRYAFRAKGPHDPSRGLRFDGTRPLIDPYSRGVVVPKGWSRKAQQGAGDPALPKLKSVVVRTDDYDWEGDRPLGRPFSRTVIYEMHVRAFTANPNSGVAPERRGTYAGVIDKIPYLRDLGVTAVELLPVFQFDVEDAAPGRRNFWGYAPLSFFAPHVQYSQGGTPAAAVKEFRDLVKALHRAGIEVILDVVYNHTAEGDGDGPTYSFRGLSNDTYYMLDADPSKYLNYSGCGNTCNANHPVLRRMIIDSLQYWVEEMHVDGFRFDLASILSRDETGTPTKRSPVLFDLESDPRLARTKLIAEAWDAAGLYEVGSFVGDSWREWNGRFRDDLRAFLRGEEGKSGAAADRLLGSMELYGGDDRVSYDRKHNEENGEDNRDGSNDNKSWNCGAEGPTDDPAIETLRNRQVKNFLALTFLSMGAPMILMGDEVRRTQHGNNNAYSTDSERTWFDWSDLGKHADILGFTKKLIAVRRQKIEHGLTLTELHRQAKIEWHGVKLGTPDRDPSSHTLSVTMQNPAGHHRFHLIINAYWDALSFELPKPAAGGWRRMVDTSLPSPDDLLAPAVAPLVTGGSYRAGARSVVVLVCGGEAGSGKRAPTSAD
jgi:glycogen operon protein